MQLFLHSHDQNTNLFNTCIDYKIVIFDNLYKFDYIIVDIDKFRKI